MRKPFTSGDPKEWESGSVLRAVLNSSLRRQKGAIPGSQTSAMKRRNTSVRSERYNGRLRRAELGQRHRIRRRKLDYGLQRNVHRPVAVTIATMPARTSSGNSGQAAKTTAKSGYSDSRLVALSVACTGRGPTLAVAPWRKTDLFSCDATPSQSEGLDVS